MARTRAVAVLVASVLLAGVGCSGGESDATPTPPPLDASYAVDGEPSCDVDVRRAPTLPLAEEPVSARLCAGRTRVVAWAPPLEVLLDPGAVADVLATAEPVPADAMCTADAGPAYDLVLTFPGGRATSVRGDTGGCGLLETVDGPRFGAETVLESFLDAVAGQRETVSPPPGRPGRPDCPEPTDGHALSFLGHPVEMEAAVSCWRPDADDVQHWRDAVPVGRRDLAVLLDDVALNSRQEDDFGADVCGDSPDWYWQDIVGRTRWGDVVALHGVCRTFLVVSSRFRADQQDGTQPTYFWHPSPRSQRILDRLRR